MYKKPAFLINTGNSLSYRHQCPQCHATSQTPHTRPARRRIDGRKEYATLAENSPEAPTWPDLQDSRRIPTPYQIFQQKPSETYSKLRFYELVKIYHPDRNTGPETSNPCGCSRTEMLERYRLVVAANAILSDPKKKDAYDRAGIGWSDWREDPTQSGGPSQYKYSTFHRWRTATAKKYKWSVDEDPMFNATWEDWERWYERQGRDSRWSSSPFHPFFFNGRREQRTLYANNGVFISLVAILAALGGIGQATRANHTLHVRHERMLSVNEENSKRLMDARETAKVSSGGEQPMKQKRIEKFMRDREGYREGEFDSRTLHPNDESVCSSGTIKDKDLPPFWQRPPENE